MAQCEINNSSICFGIINAAVDWGIRTWGIRCADALKVNKLMHEEDKHQIAHILRPRGVKQGWILATWYNAMWTSSMA